MESYKVVRVVKVSPHKGVPSASVRLVETDKGLIVEIFNASGDLVLTGHGPAMDIWTCIAAIP